METEMKTVWALARLADVYDPDEKDNPAARFLEGIAEDVADRLSYDPDGDPDEWVHKIADLAVPVYTHERWQVFVDLGAYNEDPGELVGASEDLTALAGIALYMIASRLAEALIEEDRQ